MKQPIMALVQEPLRQEAWVFAVSANECPYQTSLIISIDYHFRIVKFEKLVIIIRKVIQIYRILSFQS